MGNELLLAKYRYLVAEKKVGLVTNQSGVTSSGQSTIDLLAGDNAIRLTALYGPEHGIDGTAGLRRSVCRILQPPGTRYSCLQPLWQYQDAHPPDAGQY
ncbi:MAG: DUF1343 domain-containing protein [Candidatus Syntrophopropionicum ammoniitolerans]